MADTKTSTAYKDRYALNGKVEKWMGRGSQVVGGLAAAVGFLSGGSGIFLGALGAALFGSGVARTSRGQMRIAKSNAVNDLVLRSRGMGLKQQMLANAGKSPGMAYINAAACDPLRDPQEPGQTRPLRDNVRAP